MSFNWFRKKKEPKVIDMKGFNGGYSPGPNNELRAYGWNSAHWGWDVGDYMIFYHRDGDSVRYQIKTIRHESDPKDMWQATLTFAPRDK
jgi:hypothetical protein